MVPDATVHTFLQHKHKMNGLSHTANMLPTTAPWHHPTACTLIFATVVHYCGAAVLRGFGLTSPSCTGRM